MEARRRSPKPRKDASRGKILARGEKRNGRGSPGLGRENIGTPKLFSSRACLYAERNRKGKGQQYDNCWLIARMVWKVREKTMITNVHKKKKGGGRKYRRVTGLGRESERKSFTR